MPENLDPQGTADNPDPGTVAPAVETGFTWKGQLGADLKGNPLLAKFDDSVDGLNKAVESHANLEKLLGHEKVPVPKGESDVEGWSRFKRAFGIPEKPEEYTLKDVSLPAEIKDLGIDKGVFSQVAHAQRLTPQQAQGLWEAYNQISADSYQQLMQTHEQKMTETVNALKQEWGGAYDVNVELGQMVINKFSDDAETNDYLTAALSQDARGIKFLAKIGEQFAENKVGEFQMKRFAMAPDEIQNEIDKMAVDLNGAYMNQTGKFTEREHQEAIERMNNLRVQLMKAKSG